MRVILDLQGYYVLSRKGGLPVSHAIEFIETSMFTRQIQEIATDDELKELQRELIELPEKGDLIRGTGGYVNSEWL
ncbi:toxin RelE [Xenorhabdus ishibashii]|uniref:Toxin RelE n=1 Tax=Xenorhabdus ishibashii TaxID=1034471 RepID=A0A2D0KHQ3_9GAMM|nr:toxin RelE [Xenorhabdus ishibashii]